MPLPCARVYMALVASLIACVCNAGSAGDAFVGTAPRGTSMHVDKLSSDVTAHEQLVLFDGPDHSVGGARAEILGRGTGSSHQGQVLAIAPNDTATKPTQQQLLQLQLQPPVAIVASMEEEGICLPHSYNTSSTHGPTAFPPSDATPASWPWPDDGTFFVPCQSKGGPVAKVVRTRTPPPEMPLPPGSGLRRVTRRNRHLKLVVMAPSVETFLAHEGRGRGLGESYSRFVRSCEVNKVAVQYVQGACNHAHAHGFWRHCCLSYHHVRGCGCVLYDRTWPSGPHLSSQCQRHMHASCSNAPVPQCYNGV